MDMDDETDWESLFAIYDTPYFGYCHSVDDANDLVQEYCYRTSASFAVIRTTEKFGTFSLTRGELP